MLVERAVVSGWGDWRRSYRVLQEQAEKAEELISRLDAR